MHTELAARIEAYLLTRKGWVTAAELCDAFGVTERSLRAMGGKPGLCSDCAISGDRGFRHVFNATDAEFTSAYDRIRRHGLGELLHARKLQGKRRHRPDPQPPVA